MIGVKIKNVQLNKELVTVICVKNISDPYLHRVGNVCFYISFSKIFRGNPPYFSTCFSILYPRDSALFML